MVKFPDNEEAIHQGYVTWLLPMTLKIDALTVLGTCRDFMSVQSSQRRLFEVYDIYVSDPEEKVSDLRAMQIQENITRICFHNISKYDMPVVK